MSRILLRRGNKVDLPVLNVGELGLATDTGELFVGSSLGNVQIRFQKSGFHAGKSGPNQSVLAATPTKITFDVENYDYLSEYDISISRFTAKQAGLYLVNVGIFITNPVDQAAMEVRLHKNGVNVLFLSIETASGAAAAQQATGSGQIPLSVGDYLEIYYNSTSAATVVSNSISTYFQAAKIQ